jgi:two-component system chemotaxis response regulator CheB
VYVAPPDHHVVVSGGTVRLTAGPRENLARPAIDPLFRSAARERGPHVVGVVLSGMLDDGSLGLLAIRQAGGVAVVQEPEDALYSDMPRHALATAGADHVVRIAEMGRVLADLSRADLSRAEVKAMARKTASRLTPAEGGFSGEPPGHPSGFSCPECGGVLWEADANGGYRYECRVGHAYGAESLAADESGKIEHALWAALRAVEERASLSRRLAARAREHRQRRSAERFDAQVAEHARAALVLRDLLGAPPSRVTARARARVVPAGRTR